MAFAESGSFTSPVAHIKVHQAQIKIFTPLVNTTGSGDTSPEYSASGFEQMVGEFNGWMVSTASTALWTTLSGTLVLVKQGAVATITCTAQVFSLRGDYKYSSDDRRLVPMLCRFKSSSLLVYS